MSIFQFKQFTLVQKESAAKLTTDATIFGAWLPIEEQMKSALEIGTGTGILSLMLAQRSDLSFQALEIEEEAYKEAQNNFRCSPWANQLKAILQDFRQFRSDEKFDLIFSNPPFFTDNLQSHSNLHKNTAYHTNQLTLNDLVVGIDLCMSEKGKVYIMLPEYEMSLFSSLMQNKGYHIQHSLIICHNTNKPPLRVINGFSRSINSTPQVDKIFIRDKNNDFHPGYVALLSPFLTIF